MLALLLLGCLIELTFLGLALLGLIYYGYFGYVVVALDVDVLGILTGIFRLYGVSAEGVSYAIIIGNILVPLIEKVTLPKAFGKGGKAHA